MSVKPSLRNKSKDQLREFSCKASRVLEDFYIEISGCKYRNIIEQSTDKIKIKIQSLAKDELMDPLVEYVINEYNMYRFKEEFPSSVNIDGFKDFFEEKVFKLNEDLRDSMWDCHERFYLSKALSKFKESIFDYVKQKHEDKNE